MRIENYGIGMKSEHSKSKKVSHIFEQELQSMNADNGVHKGDKKKLDITGKELEFTKRLEYQIIQEFIYSLHTSFMQNSYRTSNVADSMNLKSIDTSEFFSPKELSSREMSISQEICYKEKLDIQMDGWIQTDTQKIKLDIDISFSSTFVQRNELTKTMFYDPLVLNFDGELPSLDDKKISFDIDCDGECDQISKLNEGNGFLALDKNNNNKIDDGTELFGAQSGNGFYDLMQYDEDNNSWIDENDQIFDSLRIWKKTDTEDELVALGEMGIGAIFLGYNEENFELKTQDDEILGRIKANGLFLNENGSAGILSQVDFAKNGSKESKDSKLTELIQSA